MKITLRQLEYLTALAELRSFHRAAAACHVSQPALSTQIRQLEDQLGIKLLERNQRMVLVTPAGEEIVRRAHMVLNGANDLIEAAQSLALPMSGTLRLGVIPTIAPYFLPRVLPRVREQYTDLRLLLYEEKTDVLLRLLQEGKLDLALLALGVELGSLEGMALFDDPFVLAVPEGHKLASSKTVRETDLSDEEVLLLEDGHCLRDQVWPVCEQGGAHELGDFRASSLSTLVQMVSSNIGITLLPEMSIEVEIGRSERIELRRFRRPVPFRSIGLVWRGSAPRKGDFRLIGEAFAGIHSSAG
jgi:LysR family transcriptional regulator, hydrogen peroxide-inducible genes activator